MKAAVHLAILVITAYEYFFPRKAVPDEDLDEEYEPADIESKNTDSLLLGDIKLSKRFNSTVDGDNESLFPFDNEEE